MWLAGRLDTTFFGRSEYFGARFKIVHTLDMAWLGLIVKGWDVVGSAVRPLLTVGQESPWRRKR